MEIESFLKGLPKPTRDVTLCFLLRDDQILLAMKKRGFGEGKWNGTGGKRGVGEAIKVAASREAEEEIGVKIHPRNLKRVATINFYFPGSEEKEAWSQRGFIYLARRWKGEPIESEEMMPQWFNTEDIPYGQMWSPDGLWISQVLQGNLLKAHFVFSKHPESGEYIVEHHQIKVGSY